jgi:hypothetical protein
MNRRSFFKFLGIGAATAVVAPKLLAEHSTPSKLLEITKSQATLISKQIERKVENQIEGLTIYEQPREGYDYSIGVETGDGRWENPSVVSVMRVGNGDEPCVQVAEYASINQGVRLASDIAYLANMYGEKCKNSRGPLIVIEQVQAPGDTVQALLKIMGFTRFFKSVNGMGIERSGFYTTRFSGPIMMDRFTAAVENGWYKPNSGCIYSGMLMKNLNQYVRAAAQSYVRYYNYHGKTIRTFSGKGRWV